MAILFVLAPVAAVGYVTRHFSRSRTTLEQWAADNEYELVRTERRFLRLGPYLWTTSKGQEVVL